MESYLLDVIHEMEYQNYDLAKQMGGSKVSVEIVTIPKAEE